MYWREHFEAWYDSTSLMWLWDMGAMSTKDIQTKKAEAAIEFLLLEYKTVADSRLQEIERGQNYVNIYLTITSAAAGVLALMNQFSPGVIRPTSIYILSVLFFLGMISFIRVIQRDMRITSHARRLSRIRHYFMEIDPGIIPYLPYSPYDNQSYEHRGGERIGLRSVVALINSVLAATILYLLGAGPLPLWALFLLAAIGFWLSMALQERMANAQARKMEKRMDIRFPEPPEIKPGDSETQPIG